MSRGRHRQVRRLNAETVLAGAAAVNTAQLIGLINEVNPTGRGLSRTEQARRYRQKNQLQALLIERFADDLDVEADPDAPGVVSIRRQHFPDDACHTVVDQLDEDSRLWVRRTLDMATDVAGSSEPTLGDSGLQPTRIDTGGSGEPLVAGQQALEQYEYETARTLFTQALRSSGGATREATALLDLLVDHLADDAGALQLARTLSLEARQNPGVRGLLALAAARLDDRQQARSWLAGTAGLKEADVWATLTRSALRENALSEAAEYLVHVQEMEPGHRDLPGLEGDLAERRDQETELLTGSMERAWTEGHVDEAERLANLICDRMPKNTRATQLLEQIQASRRSVQIRELERRAEEAWQAREYERAIDLWQQALRTGADGEELHERIQEAHRLLRVEMDSDAVGEVIRLLDLEDPERGLLGYHALSGDLRGQVRSCIELPELSWLEQIRLSGSQKRAQQDVAAMMAFRRCLDLLAADRWLEAELLMQPHVNILQRHDEARRCLNQIKNRRYEERCDRLAEVLSTTKNAIDRGETKQARSQLEIAREVGVTPDLRQRFNRLEERLRQLESHEKDKRGYEQLLTDGKLLEARAALATLVKKTQGSTRDNWCEEEDRLRDRIRSEWRMRTSTGPISPPNWWPDTSFGYEGTGCLLMPGSASAMLVRAEDRSLFILEMDTSSGQIRRWVTLLAPESLSHATGRVDAQRRLWIYSDEGQLVRLAADTLEPEIWWTVKEFLPADLTLEHIEFSPNARYLWCDTRTSHGGRGHGTNRLYVLDLDKGKVCGDRANYGWITPLLGNDDYPIADASFGRPSLTLYTSENGRGTDIRTKLKERPHDVVVHPDGRRIVILTDQWDDLGEEPQGIALQVLEAGGEVTEPWFLADDDGDAHHGMATTLESGLMFVLSGTFGGKFEISALRFGPTGPGIVWQVPVPRSTILLQEPGSMTVAALCSTHQGISVTKLGPHAPRLPQDRTDIETPIPNLDAFTTCGGPSGKVNARALALTKLLHEVPQRDRQDWQNRYVQKHGADAVAIWALALAFQELGDWKALKRVLERALAQHPRHAGLAVLAADQARNSDGWGRVRELLEDCALDGIDENTAQHWHHLMGLAYLSSGEFERARAVLLDGSRCERGSCNLAPFLELVTPLPDPLEPADWDDTKSPLRQLQGAIREADHCLARNDAKGALNAMNRPVVFRTREKQSTARLAEAFLANPPTDDEGGLRMAVTLATFLAQHRRVDTSLGRDLRVPGITWSRQHLDELAEHCRDWLRAPLPVEEPTREP